MGRDKKRAKHNGRATAKAAAQRQSRTSGRRAGRKRYAIWSLSILVIVAATAVTWSVLKAKSSRTAASSPVSQLAAAVSPVKSDPNSTDVIKPTPTAATPRLEIPQPEFDFGHVPQNAKISHVFWLYSTGTDTLKILQVSPG